MPIAVRSYSESDLVPMRQIWAAQAATPVLSLQECRNLFAASRVTLVATQDQRVVGVLRVRPCADDAFAALGVADCRVRTDCLQQGIATALCTAEIAALRRQGFDGLLQPAVAANDEAALALCRRVGLQKVGCLPDYFEPGVDGIVFYCAAPRKKSRSASPIKQK